MPRAVVQDCEGFFAGREDEPVLLSKVSSSWSGFDNDCEQCKFLRRRIVRLTERGTANNTRHTSSAMYESMYRMEKVGGRERFTKT